MVSLDCPVCYDRMDQFGKAPKALACCGSVACVSCLTDMLSDGEICCPECFQLTLCDEVSMLETPRRLMDFLSDTLSETSSTGRTTQPSESSPKASGLSAFLSSNNVSQEPLITSCSSFDEIDDVDSALLDETRRRWHSRAKSISVRSGNAFGRISEVALASPEDVLSPETVRGTFERQEQLPLADTLALLAAARDIFAREKNVLALEAPLLCVGDIHGQYEDLLTVLHGDGRQGSLKRARHQVRALEGRGSVLFLGDYVDRGSRGCEVFFYLLALKVKYPSGIHLIRGNHESRSLTGHFGFRAECRRKYGLTAYHETCRVFEALPLAAKVTGASYGDVLCCHGGIGPHFNTIDDLENIDRFQEPPDDGALCDVLWADPHRDGDDDANQQELFEANAARGCSFVFSKEATLQFLKRNNLAAIVRAHEVQEDGYAKDFNSDSGKQQIAPVTTVFSAPNYCGKYGNDAAILVLGTDRTEAIVFDAVKPQQRVVSDDASSENQNQDDDDVHAESDAVRKAYEICPYMPSSFRAIVDCAYDLLDDNGGGLVRKVAVAEKNKKNQPETPPPRAVAFVVEEKLTESPKEFGLWKKKPPLAEQPSSQRSSVAELRARFEKNSPTTPPEKSRRGKSTPPQKVSFGGETTPKRQGETTPKETTPKQRLGWLSGVFKTQQEVPYSHERRKIATAVKTPPPEKKKAEHQILTEPAKKNAKSRRFSAAVNGDAFNEMAPRAVERRVRRTTCPQLAAFLAKTNFVDSGGARGKNTILDAQRQSVTDISELQELRDELKHARKSTSSPVKAAAYFDGASAAFNVKKQPPVGRLSLGTLDIFNQKKNVSPPPQKLKRRGVSESFALRLAAIEASAKEQEEATKSRAEDSQRRTRTKSFHRQDANHNIRAASLEEEVVVDFAQRSRTDSAASVDSVDGFSDQEIYALRLIFSLFGKKFSSPCDFFCRHRRFGVHRPRRAREIR